MKSKTLTPATLTAFATALTEAIAKTVESFSEVEAPIALSGKVADPLNAIARIHAIEAEAMRHRIPKYELWAAHRAAVKGIPFDPFAFTHQRGRHAAAYAWRSYHINDLSPEAFKAMLADYLKSKGLQVALALKDL